MCRQKQHGNINQRGAVLLMVLVGVTLLGLITGIAGSSWQTIVQRGKEADLLWKGNQIRKAIGSYYETSHAGGAAPKSYPSELNFLTKDPRFLEIHRHIRKLYLDPMSGKEWEIIKDPTGRVMGVRSGSDKTPFKQNNFIEENQSFAGKQNYRDWQFIYQPKKTTPTKKIPAPENKSTTTSPFQQPFGVGEKQP